MPCHPEERNTVPCHPEERSTVPCHPEERSTVHCHPEEGDTVPCHPEERSDEGSAPETGSARADASLRLRACPELERDARPPLELILRCAQDDRQVGEGMTREGEGLRMTDRGARAPLW